LRTSGNGVDDAAALDPDHVGAQVRRAVASARTDTDPSVTCRHHDLPEDTYRALIDASLAHLLLAERRRQAEPESCRNSTVAPERTLETLAFVEQQAHSAMMVPALMKNSSRTSSISTSANTAPSEATAGGDSHEATGGRLILRRPGYHLDPHLDPSACLHLPDLLRAPRRQ